MFANLNADQLIPFILCHDSKYQTKSSLPKKGTLPEAQRGDTNKINVAFNCRER